MSHFTTKCHHSTAALGHKIAGAKEQHSSSSQILQLPLLLKRPTGPGLPLWFHHPHEALWSQFDLIFSFLLNSRTQLRVRPSLASPASWVAMKFLPKGTGQRDWQKGMESALGLPYPDRRLVNVVVGCVCNGMWPQGHVWGTANVGSVARNCSPETLSFNSVRATL